VPYCTKNTSLLLQPDNSPGWLLELLQLLPVLPPPILLVLGVLRAQVLLLLPLLGLQAEACPPLLLSGYRSGARMCSRADLQHGQAQER
jgi:hypothetical protein